MDNVIIETVRVRELIKHKPTCSFYCYGSQVAKTSITVVLTSCCIELYFHVQCNN
jgi:hypothetical protein